MSKFLWEILMLFGVAPTGNALCNRSWQKGMENIYLHIHLQTEIHCCMEYSAFGDSWILWCWDSWKEPPFRRHIWSLSDNYSVDLIRITFLHKERIRQWIHTAEQPRMLKLCRLPNSSRWICAFGHMWCISEHSSPCKVPIMHCWL